MINPKANFPCDLGTLTPAWLNSVQSRYDILRLEAESIPNNGLTADVAVIRLETRTGEKASLIAKTSSSNLETRSKFASYYQREVIFYSDIAPSSAVRIPACYFAECDGDCHLILLEDMSPAVAGDTIRGITGDFALEFVRLISNIHASWWNRAELTIINEKLPRFGTSFGVGYASALLDHSDLIAPYGRSTLKLANKLTHDLQSLWDSQWLGEQTIVQWDSHASNVMHPSGGEGDWSLLDWQNCVVGSGIWDVTRFCILSLPVEVRRSIEEEIVATYTDALAARGIQVSYGSLWSSYQHFMPLVFAQQFRFLSSFKSNDRSRDDWKEAVMPRVVAALADSL